MTTFVALTEATASMPGSSPSSATASLLISELIRNGPAWSLIRDESSEVIACGLSHRQGRLIARQLDSESCERGTVKQAVSALGAKRLDAAGVGPASNRVHADAEQLRGLTHLVRRHEPRP